MRADIFGEHLVNTLLRQILKKIEYALGSELLVSEDFEQSLLLGERTRRNRDPQDEYPID